MSFSHRRGPSTNSQFSNGWVDEGSSSTGGGEGADGNEEHAATEVEAALAQGIASSLRTLVIASFRAPPNKFVLGERNRGGVRACVRVERVTANTTTASLQAESLRRMQLELDSVLCSRGTLLPRSSSSQE